MEIPRSKYKAGGQVPYKGERPKEITIAESEIVKEMRMLEHKLGQCSEGITDLAKRLQTVIRPADSEEEPPDDLEIAENRLNHKETAPMTNELRKLFNTACLVCSMIDGLHDRLDI